MVEHDHTVAGIGPLLRPRSVAVVGASRDRAAVGRRILDALIDGGFNGPVYPVNPNAVHVGPHPAVESLAAIERTVDLAVVAVPAQAVAEVIAEAVGSAIGAVVVISAGFAEADEEGAQRQRRLLEQLEGSGTRMIGPNCLGVVNTDPELRLNASFAPELPPRGRIAFCSQSGALGIAMMSTAGRMGVGMASMVSIGNQADVGVVDLLQTWENDADVSVVTLYLESFSEPRRLAEVAAAMSTPVIAVKAGRTSAGSRAASSHTASVAGEEAAVEALLTEAGIIRAATLDEMFQLARYFESQPAPRGRSVGIITNSGGPGILCADALTASDMTVPEFDSELQSRLVPHLPDEASTENPVDMVASASATEYRNIVGEIAQSGKVDAVVAIYTEIEIADRDAVGRAITDGISAGREQLPAMAVVIGTDQPPSHIRGEGAIAIPTATRPEEAASVLAEAARHAERRRSGPGTVPDLPDLDVDRARSLVAGHLETDGPGWMSPLEARELLDAAGATVPPHGLATSVEEAVSVADGIDGPVALTVVSPDIVHKTDAEGVHLGLEDDDEIARAYREIEAGTTARSATFAGVLVQPMLDGTELIVGSRRAERYGPLVTFGSGGVLVEVLEDVTTRLAPLTDAQARDMIGEIKGHRLLTGYRNQPEADLHAVEDLLIRVSQIGCSISEIAEFEINPAFAGPEGCFIGDVRIRLAKDAVAE